MCEHTFKTVVSEKVLCKFETIKHIDNTQKVLFALLINISSSSNHWDPSTALCVAPLVANSCNVCVLVEGNSVNQMHTEIDWPVLAMCSANQ